jgi:hypothetical protein
LARTTPPSLIDLARALGTEHLTLRCTDPSNAAPPVERVWRYTPRSGIPLLPDDIVAHVELGWHLTVHPRSHALCLAEITVDLRDRLRAVGVEAQYTVFRDRRPGARGQRKVDLWFRLERPKGIPRLKLGDVYTRAFQRLLGSVGADPALVSLLRGGALGGVSVVRPAGFPAQQDTAVPVSQAVHDAIAAAWAEQRRIDDLERQMVGAGASLGVPPIELHGSVSTTRQQRQWIWDQVRRAVAAVAGVTVIEPEREWDRRCVHRLLLETVRPDRVLQLMRAGTTASFAEPRELGQYCEAMVAEVILAPAIQRHMQRVARRVNSQIDFSARLRRVEVAADKVARE